MVETDLTNPFKPGAGHMPPYLAGRESEKHEFAKLIAQSTILENLVLTGLRGVGKTVLLDVFKPIAQTSGWYWVGTDLTEAATLSEKNIATRLLTDLSVLTSSIVIGKKQSLSIGFLSQQNTETHYLNFQTLIGIYEQTPGLPGDKLKYVLELIWDILKEGSNFKGIVFAYDEAQNLADQTDK